MTAAALAFLAAALATGGCGLLAGSLSAGSRRGKALPPRSLVAAGRRLRRAGLAAPRDLEARVVAAGRPAGLGARELMAAKIAAALAGGAAGLVPSSFAPGRLGFAVAMAAPAAGFLVPDLWLARRSRERAARIRSALPALLDLLRVSIEAGRSLPAALRDVGTRATGPLAAEWRTVGRAVAVGVPLDRALAEMAERAPLIEIRALVAALDRARRHGAPLAGTLAAQARDARFAVARRARERAARAGPKIQLVVALLMVPSVLLLVAAGLLGALLEDGAGDGGVLIPL